MTNSLVGQRLLIVEDEYFLAEDIVLTLRNAGVDVIGPAPNVDAALALLETSRDVDGAVIDLNLQGEMAFPVADALIERRIPLVFATGYDDASIPTRYKHITRCEKPVNVEHLLQVIAGMK